MDVASAGLVRHDPGPDERPALPGRAVLARRPVMSAMIALAVVLTAVSGRYGYHRDELYFRMLKPAWGYLDQPPLTPLLVRTLSRLVNEPWAIRLPATAAAVASVLVLALVTRELGGGRTAQALCAWGYAFASIPLVMGHVMLTTSIDMVVWPAVTLLVMRALLRDPRWWVAAGAVVGLSTYNKLLVAMLVGALGIGLATAGPRSAFRSRWLAAGVALALLVGAPNLAFQITNRWPQLTMGAALRAHNAGDVRVQMWPFLLLLLGPPLVPIWAAGVISLVRRQQWRPVRCVAVALPVVLGLTWLAGAQIYYPVGLLSVLFAAGCVPTGALMDRRPRWRRAVVALVALNAGVSSVISLPLLPLSVLGESPVPAINQSAGDSVGWPTYVRQVAGVYAALPATRTPAVVIASNYGEAGAVARYGPALGLPLPYSGQNALFAQARPPEGTDTAIVVGGQLDEVRHLFASCAVAARLDNHVGVDNEEQGEPVAVCSRPVAGWATIWPSFRHLD